MRVMLASLILPALSVFAQAPTPALRPVPPSAVRLLDGPFKVAQDADVDYLLGLSADRLLARFRADAGLPAVAEGYGGWEADTIGGHTLGHYLSGCAKMYASTGDTRFRDRVAAIVDELAACQAANTAAGVPGYVAAIPNGKKVFAELKAGDIRSKGFDLNGLWVPWYTLHKLMAGLRDAHALCDNARALEVWKGLADFSLSVVGALDDKQLNLMLRCEHGGMNEVAADLYAITRDPKHLDLARRFCDWQVLDPLADGKDILPGLHANTQVPKLIGAARLYELTGEEKLRKAAEFFWTTVSTNHTYANGGNSLNEYFGPAGALAARLQGNTSETCNTYNMLKLTKHLHAWRGPLIEPPSRTPSDPGDVMAFYERSLYSHILASQDPRSARVLYYTPLRNGGRKDFQRLHDDFTCCVGSGMENHASYGDAIYSLAASADVRTIVVDLYIPSQLTMPWGTLRQERSVPDSTQTSFTVRSKEPLTLLFRRPWWAASTTIVNNGGAPQQSDQPGYTRVDLKPRAGESELTGQIDIRFEIKLQAFPAPDDPSVVSLHYGPVLMAAPLGTNEPSPAALPVLVVSGKNDLDAPSWFKQKDGELAFTSTNAVRPSPVSLVPFYRILDDHYTVYWRRLDESQWQAQLALIRAEEERRRELERMTVDFVQPGEMQPERDHDFQGDRTNQGEHRGLRWRDAYRGGWFSFKMKSDPAAKSLRLVCTYWGSDTGDRDFDILIDDTVIATQKLDRNKPGEFFDVTYDIPAELVKGKADLRVKFRCVPPKTAGGVFGVRVIRGS